MSLSSVSLDHAAWYNWTVLLCVVFLFVGVPLARRNRYALLVCSLPVVWSIVATTLSLMNVIAGVSIVRFPRAAAAAGVADSAYPLLLGAGIVAILATILAIVSRRSPPSRVSMTIELPPLLFAAAVALFDALLGRQLLTGKFSLSWFGVTRLVMWAGAAVFAVCCVLAVRGFRIRAAETGTARPFVVLAVVNAVAALALFAVYRAYWKLAITG